jgi:hypothetical protein
VKVGFVEGFENANLIFLFILKFILDLGVKEGSLAADSYVSILSSTGFNNVVDGLLFLL